MIVTEDAGDDSIEIVVVVPAIVSTVVVVGIGVVGLRGVALPSVVLVFSILGSGFGFSGVAVVDRWFKRSLFLRLFLLSWSHRIGCKGRE